MSVRPLLDEHSPNHGQWVGLGLGWVSEVWLTHFLSQADRRLHHVDPWAEQPLHWRVPWPSARRSSVSGCPYRCLWRQTTRFWSRQRLRDFQSTTRSSTHERTGRARHSFLPALRSLRPSTPYRENSSVFIIRHTAWRSGDTTCGLGESSGAIFDKRPPSEADRCSQAYATYGMKFSSSGSGGTIGTSNSGMGPSGSMTSVPSEAKNSAICACAPRAMPNSRGENEKGTLLNCRKTWGSFGTAAGSMAKARSFR